MITKLRLIYSVEISKLCDIVERGERELSEKEIKRLTELTKGIKELEAIPEFKPRNKEVSEFSTVELMELARREPSD
jgi:hypothetical protein